MANKIDFIVISTKNKGIFITDNVENKSYFTSKIPNLFFDGVKLVATFKSEWYKLSKIPQNIKIKGQDTYTNKRYELKSGYPVSELTPQVMTYDDFDSDDETAGLYIYKYDIVEGQLEDVEFNIEILSEEDNFYAEKPKYPSTPSLITSLTIHPVLHTERPCSISGAELYKIIRAHVKANINPRYASVSSDYDFCLSVNKIITHEPESYTINVGKRKPKYETRYKRNRIVKILEISPQRRDGYLTQEGLTGKNQKDLEEKVDKYLEDLMENINKPYIECSCCNGLGVIIEKV